MSEQRPPQLLGYSVGPPPQTLGSRLARYLLGVVMLGGGAFGALALWGFGPLWFSVVVAVLFTFCAAAGAWLLLTKRVPFE